MASPIAVVNTKTRIAARWRAITPVHFALRRQRCGLGVRTRLQNGREQAATYENQRLYPAKQEAYRASRGRVQRDSVARHSEVPARARTREDRVRDSARSCAAGCSSVSFFRRLFTGCMSHQDHYERDPDDRLQLVCDICGDRRYVLATPLMTGPCHAQGEVLGACKAKARPGNVEPIDKRKRA
jgi:hypothetical protein